MNAGVAVYQFAKIRRQHLNPLTQELYTDTKAYQSVVEENR